MVDIQGEECKQKFLQIVLALLVLCVYSCHISTVLAGQKMEMEMQATDNAVVNLPLAKRGNIDTQIDVYKREQAKLAKQEGVKADRHGVLHLCKGGMIRVFANRTQAENAAARTGGEAYQSIQSRRFLVRFVA